MNSNRAKNDQKKEKTKSAIEAVFLEINLGQGDLIVRISRFIKLSSLLESPAQENSLAYSTHQA